MEVFLNVRQKRIIKDVTADCTTYEVKLRHLQGKKGQPVYDQVDVLLQIDRSITVAS